MPLNVPFLQPCLIGMMHKATLDAKSETTITEPPRHGGLESTRRRQQQRPRVDPHLSLRPTPLARQSRVSFFPSHRERCCVKVECSPRILTSCLDSFCWRWRYPLDTSYFALPYTMAHVHGPLTRTNTAPVFPTRKNNSGPGLTQTMSHNSRSSQLSGSTAYTSSSTTSLTSMSSSATLVPPQNTTTPMANGGNVVATNNIINQRADASRSLYHACVSLTQRLNQVPGFDVHLDEATLPSGSEDDPVSFLWRCLRNGPSLLTIYNSIHPPEPLTVDMNLAEKKRNQISAFKLIEACMRGELKIPSGECFQLSDLFGDDTTGLVKVSSAWQHPLIVLDRGISIPFL